MGRQHLTTVVAAAVAGLWGAGVALPHWRGESSVLDRIEAPATDLRFLIQGPRPAPESVTIIAIDDQTARDSGTYPLPRATVARLVEILATRQPKAIALDILFLDPGPEDSDRALAQALRRAPAILAAAALFDRTVQRIPHTRGDWLGNVPRAQDLLPPVKGVADAAGFGIVNISTDRSGVPRHVPLLLRAGDQLVPSFSLRTVSVASGQDPELREDAIEIGGVSTTTDVGYALPLRFYGPRGSIRTLSAKNVLAERIANDAIRGRIVVVGTTVTGGGDVFPTPFDPVLPGVEVLATAIAHLVEGDGLRRDRRVRLVDGVVAVVLPIFLVLLLAWKRSTLGLAFIGGITLLWIGVTAAAFTQGIWLSMALPLAAAVPSVVLFAGARLWLDRRRADLFAATSAGADEFDALAVYSEAQPLNDRWQACAASFVRPWLKSQQPPDALAREALDSCRSEQDRLRLFFAGKIGKKPAENVIVLLREKYQSDLIAAINKLRTRD